MSRNRPRIASRAILASAIATVTALALGTPAALAASPTITSFTPPCGPVGTVVTITGTGFSDAPSPVSAVTFNGTAATAFTVNSDTQITATVPTGATTGTIVVSTPSGKATSATSFTVTTGGADHDRSISLTLRRHLVARGRVTSDVDTCESGVTVKVQRRKHGRWRTVETGTTTSQGRFRFDLTDRPGRYRSLAPEQTVGTDTCLQATSPIVRNT